MTFLTEHSLGDFFRIKHGYAFKSKFFAKEGDFIVLTPGNFKEHGGLKSQGEKEKFYTADPPPDFILRSGDLLTVMTDLTQEARILGASAFVREGDRFLHNQRLGKIIDLDTDRLDKNYLYHLFNWSHVRDQLKGSATGSTVRHTAPDRIYAVTVPLPPLPNQQRIAAILSAYDDLIENNTRRIAILEEMARWLYEEWFVHFRFPGHEEVEFEGELPKGWKTASLAQVAKVNPEAIKPRSAPKHINYIDIASVSPGRIDAVQELAYSDAPGRARRIVRDGDIIWSCVRPNRRSHALVMEPAEYTVASTGFAVLRATEIPFSFLLASATTNAFVDYLTNHATGAAYPAVKQSDFEAAAFVLPDRSLVETFDHTMEPMLRFAHKLDRKNANLRTQRDLLLPKLVSGEIDVSEAEEAMEAAQ